MREDHPNPDEPCRYLCLTRFRGHPYRTPTLGDLILRLWVGAGGGVSLGIATIVACEHGCHYPPQQTHEKQRLRVVCKPHASQVLPVSTLLGGMRAGQASKSWVV